MNFLSTIYYQTREELLPVDLKVVSFLFLPCIHLGLNLAGKYPKNPWAAYMDNRRTY